MESPKISYYKYCQHPKCDNLIESINICCSKYACSKHTRLYKRCSNKKCQRSNQYMCDICYDRYVYICQKCDVVLCQECQANKISQSLLLDVISNLCNLGNFCSCRKSKDY